MELRSFGLTALTVVTLAAAVAGCGRGSAPAGRAGDHLTVVAAEGFWGSIASQLGGTRVTVRTIITNPDADPHSYEPTPADARNLARAGMVVYNGIGYDPWVQELLAANPVPGRPVLNVGDLVGIPPGANPHRWYSPSNVGEVIDAITAGYRRALPRDGSFFDQQRDRFVTSGLARYHSLLAAIRAKYAGTPVGASESIFAPMARALGLDLLTPATFLDAVSEGGEPTAADKATIDNQIRSHAIKVYVFNSQNSTPDVQAQVNEARAEGIPVTAITETMTSASATFESWQAHELESLQTALARATGR